MSRLSMESFASGSGIETAYGAALVFNEIVKAVSNNIIIDLDSMIFIPLSGHISWNLG